MPASMEEVEHRGIRWRRPGPDGPIEFFDPNTSDWVAWAPGVDAPPRPPGWEEGGRLAGRPGRPARPGWRTPWRLVPLIVTALVVVVAVVQVLRPSTGNVKNEQNATAALLGKCLARTGTAEGHPKYSANPVPCTSPSATVKVEQVLPSTPGSPECPVGTTGFERLYQGVQYPHILCLRQLH